MQNMRSQLSYEQLHNILWNQEEIEKKKKKSFQQSGYILKWRSFCANPSELNNNTV